VTVGYFQKSPIMTYPTCIWHPTGGDSIQLSPRSLASENQFLTRAVTTEQKHVTDKQTGRQHILC